MFRTASRVTFLSCGFLSVVALILYLSFGVPDAKDAVDSVKDANNELTLLLNDALRILDNLNTAGDSAVEERDYVSVQLDYICPNAEGDAEILGIDLAGVTSAYQDSIDRLEDFETDVIPDIIDDIETGLDWAEDTDALIDYADNVFNIIQISCIAILVLVSFLTGVLLLDWSGKAPPLCRQILVWVIFPLLSVFSLISMFLAVISGTMVIVNADFCSGGDAPGSPSDSIIAILKELDISVSSYAFLGALYFTKNCATDYPFPFYEYKDELDNSSASAQSFMDSIKSIDDEVFRQVCGSDHAEAVALGTYLDNIIISLQSVNEDLIGTDGLLTCNRISDIYVDAVDETVCRKTMEVWNWSFMVTTCLLACSLLMLTLRPFYKSDPSASNTGKSVFHEEKDFQVKEVVLGDEDNSISTPVNHADVGEKVVRGDEDNSIYTPVNHADVGEKVVRGDEGHP